MTRKRDELLDHDVDGIREFDNDLPRWWLYGFYFTMVFAAAYLVNYHVMATPLFGARTVAAEYEAEMAAHPKAMAADRMAVSGTLVALKDPASLAKGQAIFESQTHPCAACHRPDLGGLVGPNLTDDVWLHGCGIAEIVHDVTTGYPLQGMLPYGGGPPLTSDELLQVGSYILSKQGSHPPNPKASDPARDKGCR